MYRKLLLSKIHRATVTETNLNYKGSITIDEELLEMTGMLPYEEVEIYNITNGQRFTTYIIKGAHGMRQFCLNGAAARLAEPGDRIIIVNFGYFPADEIKECHPKVVVLDEENKIVNTIV